MQPPRESTLALQRPFLSRSSWRAYAQLIRLPNVFTALADIALGWLCAVAAGTPAARWPSFLLLMASSACLYSAGMIWNDFFDVEQDQRERPFRPIPSGRISRRVQNKRPAIRRPFRAWIRRSYQYLAATGPPQPKR